MIFVQLFVTFFVIGMFTFGGGYAMLSLIQTEVVVRHAWLTESSFTDIVGISQMTPGPIGINCATYVGYDVVTQMTGSPLLGIAGSATATLALMLPSFLIMLALVRVYRRFKESTMYESVMSFLRPAVVGLIGAAAVILAVDAQWQGMPLLSELRLSVVRENMIDWKSWALLAGAFVAGYWGKVGPIAIIIIGGVLGFVLY